MKKYILSVLVCLLGLSHLQADNISVPDVTIEPGQSATVAISLNNTEANLVSFQMDLTLPEGISINKSGCSLSSRFTDEDQELTIGKQGTNVYRLTSTSFALIPITGTSGEIITLSLTASDNSEGGTATLSNIRFVTSESGKVVVSDASFSITVATPSPAITFADSNVKELCVANWDTDDDGELSLDEAAAVTSLGEVFRGNTEIISFDEISYFTGLTGFDDDAFNGCSGLTSFTIPSNITSIGRRAFQNCSSLASITIPESVTGINYHAFSYCTGITSITVDPGNGVYDSRYDCNAIIKTSANQLVAGCKNTIIPDNVTRIGNYSFMGCTGLTTITIPESVTAIGTSAFYDCSDLASIEIPNSVTSIESAAFRKCSSLTTVTVEMSTPFAINENVFSNRANATLFVPVGSKAAYEAADYWKEFGTIVEYGNITFADSNVKELCVANWDTDHDGELSVAEAAAVTELGEVFKGNTEITSFDELAYFTGMTTISADAFSGCTSLTSVKLPSTVTSIGHGAFWNCGQLESIDFNGCKASIKYSAFEKCTSLVNITLPSGTYPDGYSCFLGCTSLKSFAMEASDNLPDTWPEGALSWCTNLETAVVYGKVLRGPNNFRKCTSLQTVTYLDNTPGNSYNQNFREAASGIQFIIPEGSAETFLRQGYVKLSDKSALPIAREEFEDEVARIEAMATAAGSDATALSQAISEARTIVNNATDYPTVFAQIAAVKESARGYIATATLTDEVDVTAAYVANPDITRFDIGWQTPSGWMASGYQTASYTNGDVSIDHFVEMQKSDGALPDGKISQTISQLPAGKYRLEADVIAANALSDAEVTGVNLFMGGVNTAVATEDKKPQPFSVELIITSTQDVEIGINVASTTANWVAADNFRLYYLESLNDVIADLITDATEENPANLTTIIRNPSFNNDNGEGWQGDEAEFNEENSHPNNARFVNSDSFDFYQDLSGLPNGRYLLKVKGFHRPGPHDNAYADYMQGKNNASAVVYANSCSKVLPHIATGAQDALPDGCASVDAVTYNNQTQYIPRKMNDVRIFFGMGLYENELPVTVTDGTLRIGIKLENGGWGHMVTFDDFRLYYLQNKNIEFADANVKALCVANWDTNGDGELSEAEAAAVAELGEVFKGNTEITSFDELAYFTGMTTISADAFSGCTSLTSVKLPSTVTSIGHGAFWNCGQLESIDFNGCKASIKYSAFEKCTSLVNITLPSGTYPDGYSCFLGCTSLKSFAMEASDNLPDTWPEGALSWCTNLETAVVYGKVLRGPNNFRKCTSLQTVTYLDNTPGNSYNQNFREAASGIQFIIPEGSAETFLRQGYVKLSDKSALPIAREEFEDEVARIEAMATAAGSDATALSQAISEARTIVNNATDYPTVFAQIAAVKESARGYIATATLTDEVDVTAAYVANPDITRFDIGWQTPSGWMASGYQTASYTNGDVSIDHFVEMQKSDGALPDGKISQTISQLPAGKYRLEADVIAANALSDAEVTGVNLFMGGVNTAVATEDKKPQHFSVEFTNTEKQDVEIGINIASTTANWVAADNFRLYYQDPNHQEPEIDVTDISQLDNAVYIEPFEGRVSNDVNIEVRLKNVEEATSYGFELVLPEGMSIATEADGSFDEQVTLSARHKGHSAVTNKLSATTYKVAVASMNSKLLTGNDGVVVTIKAHVADNMAVGQYPVVIQNPLLVNGDATKPDMQETTTAVTIEDYVKGDVDGDTEVDLADAVIVINHYVGKPVNKFNEKAADVDGDGIVDLADAVKIINYYVGKIPSLSRKHIADELDPQ